jgi:hypothetical protein
MKGGFLTVIFNLGDHSLTVMIQPYFLNGAQKVHSLAVISQL